MPAPAAILNKIKLLLGLTQSSNVNEASNAKEMAEKLIAKYNITPEELQGLGEKTFYGENEKLFVTVGLSPWRQQLALAIAIFFECQIVQEELVPGEGLHQFSYFVYGDPDQVKNTQFVYHAFTSKINYLVDTMCLGRGPIYIDSYCEGVAQSIKSNIELEGIEIPEIKRPSRKIEDKPVFNASSLTPTKNVKESPTDNRVDVNGQSLIKDITAYFRGLQDGRDLSLQDVLEVAAQAEEVTELP